jgi:hypothetical protein
MQYLRRLRAAGLCVRGTLLRESVLRRDSSTGLAKAIAIVPSEQAPVVATTELITQVFQKRIFLTRKRVVKQDPRLVEVKKLSLPISPLKLRLTSSLVRCDALCCSVCFVRLFKYRWLCK